MAFCENCGREISDRAPMCPSCGHPNPMAGSGGAAVGGARRVEGNATASLVLGIAGLVVCPLVCSILAIVFGNSAKRKLEADPSLEGEGFAKAGVILGWVGIALFAVGVLFFIVAVAISAGTATSF